MKDSQGIEFKVGNILVSTQCKNDTIMCTNISKDTGTFIRQTETIPNNEFRINQSSMNSTNWIKI